MLWHLRDDTFRFGELRRKIPDITTKVLLQRLRKLEAEGVVHREAYTEVPPRVEYSLTDVGETLRPVMDTMCRWGSEYMERTSSGEPVSESDRQE